MTARLMGERPNSPKINVSSDDIGQRSYTREFHVRCSTVADGPGVALRAPGLPRLYQPYVFGTERDAYALARTIRADRLLGGTPDWVVSVEYRTINKAEIERAYDNPLLQLPEVETATEKYQMPVYWVYDLSTLNVTKTPKEALQAMKDLKITPCRASNGQVFDPPPVKDMSRLILTITRNESISLAHPAIDVAYSDTLNGDVFWGCLPGTWKCQGITTKREVKQLWNGNRMAYLRCTYKFEARPYWDTYLLDAGSYYVKKTMAGVEQRFIFKSDDGHPITGPLDGFGDKLAPGANPVYRAYSFYPRVAFAPLALPQSFASVA